MGKLIIDGNSVFEIDEECLKKKKIPKDCDVEKYMTQNNRNNYKKRKNKATE